MLGGKLLASAGVHNDISTISDTFHDRFIQACIMGSWLRARRNRRYFFPDFNACVRLARDGWRIFRWGQWAQFAWIPRAQAAAALGLCSRRRHREQNPKSKLTEEPQRVVKYRLH
jgi:hypothetical protein